MLPMLPRTARRPLGCTSAIEAPFWANYNIACRRIRRSTKIGVLTNAVNSLIVQESYHRFASLHTLLPLPEPPQPMRILLQAHVKLSEQRCVSVDQMQPLLLSM